MDMPMVEPPENPADEKKYRDSFDSICEDVENRWRLQIS